MTQATKAEIKEDGIANVLVGLASSQDKTRFSKVDTATILTDQELTDLWVGEGIGHKIVSTVADDMTRDGFTIPEDVNGKMEKELFRLDVDGVLNQALKWMRLYGGSLVVVGIKDGMELWQPAGKISGISWLKVFSRDEVTLIYEDIITDPSDPEFGQAETYWVTPRYGKPFRVHASRTLLFRGEPLPALAKDNQQQYYWGMSAIQPAWDYIMNLSGGIQSLTNLMYELVVGKYKLAGLQQLLAEADGEKKVLTRMNIINQSKSLINGVILGDGEEYTRDSAAIAGIGELVDRLMMMLAGACDIPITKLLGRSPAGENSTGESDLRNYYDMVSAAQVSKELRPLLKLLNMINQYLNIAPEITVEFEPLMTPTPKEEMELRKSQSEQDALYIDRGVLYADEVRQSRFDGGYSFETAIEEGAAAPIPEPQTTDSSDKPAPVRKNGGFLRRRQRR